MKKNTIFDRCVANIAPEVMAEVDLNVDIANRIYDILKAKNMTQREFAALMGKRESEISRWLTGSHGFTTNTLAKISAVLGEPVVEVKKESRTRYVFVPFNTFMTPNEAKDGIYNNVEESSCLMAYLN